MIKAIRKFFGRLEPKPNESTLNSEPVGVVAKRAAEAFRQIDADDAKFKRQLAAMAEGERAMYQETMDVAWAIDELISSVRSFHAEEKPCPLTRVPAEVAIQKVQSVRLTIDHIKTRRDSYTRGAILTRKEGQPCFEQIVADELTTILNMLTARK